MENRLARYLAVTVMTIVLTSGCSGTAPGAPKTDSPRYQMQVVGVVGERGTVYVYRLDTATGEIETFLVSSPQMVQRLSPEGAKMLSEMHGSMTFTPGPTLAGRR